MQIMKLGFRVATICAAAQILFDSTTHDLAWEAGLLEVVKDANAVDRDYQAHADEYSHAELFQHCVRAPPKGFGGLEGMMLTTYNDLWTGYFWIGAMANRGHVNEVLLHCFELLGCNAEGMSLTLEKMVVREDSVTRSRRIVEEMVVGVCESVPFMLGMWMRRGTAYWRGGGRRCGGT